MVPEFTQCPKCKTLTLNRTSNESEKENYEKRLNWESYENYLRPFREKQAKIIISTLKKFTGGKDLLDIGCAAGWFLNYVQKSGFLPFGIEPQANLVRMARKNCPKAKITIGDIQKNKLSLNNFNVVTLLSVFEHFDNPQKAIQFIKRVIKPNGLLVIQTPNGQSWTMFLSRFLLYISRGKISTPIITLFQSEYVSKHWYVYNKNSLQNLLEKFGFKVLQTDFLPFIDSASVPGWFLARGKKLSPFQSVILQLAWKIYMLLNRLSGNGDDILIFAKKQQRN